MNYCAHKINGQFVVIRVKKSNNIEQQETTRDNSAKQELFYVVLCCFCCLNVVQRSRDVPLGCLPSKRPSLAKLLSKFQNSKTP